MNENTTIMKTTDERKKQMTKIQRRKNILTKKTDDRNKQMNTTQTTKVKRKSFGKHAFG